MKKNYRFLFLGLLTVILLCSISTLANAKTLFTYQGWRIWDKPSVKTAYISSGHNCTVKHTQTKNYGRNVQFSVLVQRNTGWKWKTVGQKTFFNNVTGSKFTTYCSKGTYRLYFSAPTADQSCDISGSFYY